MPENPHHDKDHLTQELERYREIFNSVSESIAILNSSGQILEVNNTMTTVFGHSDDELKNKSLADLLILSSLSCGEMKYPQLLQAVMTGEKHNFEGLCKTHSGDEFWADITLEQFKNKRGPQKMRAVIQDISGLHKYSRLCEMQRDLGLVFSGTSTLEVTLQACIDSAMRLGELTAAAIYLFDVSTGSREIACQYGFSSTALKQISSFTVDSQIMQLILAGQPIFKTHSELLAADPELILEQGMRVLALIPVYYENDIIGSLIAASTTCDKLSMPVRTALESYIAQMSVAIARAKTSQELVQSESNYRTLFNKMGQGLIVLDKDGLVLDINTAATGITGILPPELKQSYFPGEDVILLKPDGHILSEKDHPVTQVLKTGEPIWGRILGWQSISTGEIRWVRLNAAPKYLEKLSDPYSLNITLVDITEQKIAQDELTHTQALLTSAIEQTPAGIIIADAQNIRINLVNTAALKIRGDSPLPLESIEMKDHAPNWQVYYPDGTPCKSEDLPLSRAILHGEIVQNKEMIIRDAQGIDHWILANAAPVTDTDGKIVAGVVVFPEITASKMAVEALRESESKFRSLFESSPMGMHFYSLEPDGALVFRDANPAASLLTGVDCSQFIGKTIEDAFPPLKDTEVPDRYRRAARDGETWSTQQIAYEDTKIKGAFEVYAFQTSTDKMVAMFLEVTERIRNIEELKRLRNLLGNILDSMPSIIIGVDSKGLISHWNREAERATKISADDAVNHPLQQIYPIMENLLDIVEQAISKRQTLTRERQPTELLGITRIMDVAIFPLVANGVEGAVIRIDDRTEHVRLEEIMIQSEKMMSVGGMAAGMAHEINNPLAGILQNAQVIQNRLSDNIQRNRDVAQSCGTNIAVIRDYLVQRQVLEMLDVIIGAGRRAAGIVHNMLSFSRKSESRMAPHQMDHLLDRTMELAANDYDLKKNYDFRKIQIKREYSPDLPPVSCTESEIQQVVLNLLKNGAQAMHGKHYPDGENPQFTLVVQPEDDMIRIEIADNGPGMDERIRKRVFEPFFTTKAPGLGTGLGLSVSYFIIVKNHGGSLVVDSLPGEGVRFIIHLPLTRGEK